MKKIAFSILIFAMSCVAAWAQGVQKFDFASEAWHLNGQNGQRLTNVDGVSGTVLEVRGNGTFSNAWELDEIPLIPSTAEKKSIVQLQFKARRVAGGGGGMTGFAFCNYDIPITDQWQTFRLISIVEPGRTTSNVRLGQWFQTGTFQFAEMEVTYVSPFYAENGLSREESFLTDEKMYSFKSAWGNQTSNESRCFESSSCWFNSNRWCLSKDTQITFRFDAPDFAEGKFFDATLDMTVGYYNGGTLEAYFSLDGENWTLAGKLDQAGSLVDQALGAWPEGVKTVWVRFSKPDAGGLQLYEMGFRGRMSGEVAQTAGNVPIGTVSAMEQGETLYWELVSGAAGFPAPTCADLPKTESGMQTAQRTVRWTDADGVSQTSVVRCRYFVPDFYREDFGAVLAQGSKDCPLWWCNATHKVTQKRGLPKDSGKIQISAAGNDFESFQLVLRPKSETTVLSATISNLRNAAGVEISSENVDIRKVYYHYVHHTTDSTGVCDFWPDALPPLETPSELPAGQNSPLWVTTYVPAGTPAGDYTATVTLELKTTKGVKTFEIPYALHVWGFDIPASNHVETAFGYSPGTCERYHGVKTPDDRRRLNEMYLKLLSDYRISPYNPVPFDGYQVRFEVDREHPEKSRAIFDWTAFDAEFARVLEKYHFTGFQIRLPGMGGGTFHERYAPSLEGFEEGTPEFQAMFTSMASQIENHFREKGWLDMTYVYWFDEPEPKDYEFVRDGMNRIKHYGPGIPTMLTEEPSEDVVADNKLGKVDIWCPVTPNFDSKIAEQCRARGERFWWYVCCWPHAPYCTEFIDHSAVEMRTWLWQTWQYDVRGILVWATNYWTSNTAFPDSVQDPYLDPMCYVSGYSTPVGTKRYWGNGDGRFYYPPLSCAQPSSEPNFDTPVPSMRLALMREGIEDYEMFYLLRERLNGAKNLSDEKRAQYEALLSVPTDVTKSTTEFNFSPVPMYEHRAKLAKAIEELE